MKLWLVFRNYFENNYKLVPQSMRDVGEKFNLKCEIFYEEYFSLVVVDNELQLFYKNEKIKDLPDAAFFKCYNFEVMDYLKQHKILLVNSLRGMKLSKNKYETYKLANSLQILEPKTIYSENYDYNFVSQQLGLPFVMKDNYGERGENVYLIKNEKQFLETKSKSNSLICQEFIKESKGKDIRLYVVGGKVIGSIERAAQGDEFRSNVCQGATTREVSVPNDLKRTAIKLAKKMGLSICSVDFMLSGNKYYMNEVNGNASYAAFLNLGYDMYKIVMEFISKNKFNR